MVERNTGGFRSEGSGGTPDAQPTRPEPRTAPSSGVYGHTERTSTAPPSRFTGRYQGPRYIPPHLDPHNPSGRTPTTPPDRGERQPGRRHTKTGIPYNQVDTTTKPTVKSIYTLRKNGEDVQVTKEEFDNHIKTHPKPPVPEVDRGAEIRSGLPKVPFQIAGAVGSVVGKMFRK